MSTSSLTAALDSLGQMFTAYFQVMINSVWGIVLGITIIVGVVGFIIWGIYKITHLRGK